jgi:hypothetical protein
MTWEHHDNQWLSCQPLVVCQLTDGDDCGRRRSYRNGVALCEAANRGVSVVQLEQRLVEVD